MPKKTFDIINFGCRATQADGAAIEQAFLNHHLGKSENWEDSDVVVINTCTVTHSADTQARQMIRRVHRENPKAKIVVTGCYAQRDPTAIAKIQGVTCVVGNSHKEQLASLVVNNHMAHPALPVLQDSMTAENWGASVYCSSIFESRELRSIADMTGGGRTRPVLKVQDGCPLRCSYCVIPYVRGHSRSLPEEEVLWQVENLLNHGYKEIVFTGIHLGVYGRDFENKRSLAHLVKRVLQLERLERLRLSSIEPLEVTDEVIELLAESPKVAKHFHVPLQSGSDRILQLMRRPYRSNDYTQLLEKIRNCVPEAAIGADVMVGFPTETETDHESTKEVLMNAPITYLHVFPYSRRPGTPAANLEPAVPGLVAQRRGLEIRKLGVEKNLRFRTSFLGKELSVITLDKESEGQRREAMSTNYLKVELLDPAVEPNQVMEVLVTEVTSSGLRGHRLPQAEWRIHQSDALPL